MSDGSTGEIKRLLRVDLDTLQLALDNTSYSISYYLDLETGNVVTIMEESQHEWEALRDTWESSGRALSSQLRVSLCRIYSEMGTGAHENSLDLR